MTSGDLRNNAAAWWIAGAALAFGVLMMKTKKSLAVVDTLDHFTASEFGASLPFLDPDLLRGLDRFRDLLGRKVVISPAVGSLYRPGDVTSQHGSGRAADIMLPDGPSLAAAFRIAQAVPEFGGVGVYPFWSPYPGLHLDTRPRGEGGRIATWGDIGKGGSHNYVAAAQALAAGGIA